MARTLNRLSARQISAFKQSGRYADGGGLYLRLSPAGARSWVFMNVTGGKRTEIGLGAATSISLATARQLAAQMREALALGQNPRSVLLSEDSAESLPVPTFAEYTDTYISSIENGWKNDVHRQQWRNSLRDHAQHLASLPLDEIGTDDILAVLRPIWTTKSETARRVRGRIERILDAAKVMGLRPRDAMNPALWKGHLAFLLPRQAKDRGHHAALPCEEAPSFMAALRARDALSARALEFIILTAARSGEVLGATWNEIDFEGNVWTVPATRMKASAEHQVPLSAPAIEVLKTVQQPTFKKNDKIFGVQGAARSNMAIAMLLRRMGYGHITTHGFRSTFRDWAGDNTEHAREVIENALAHSITNKAEAAYRRKTALEKRRTLMSDWSAYLSGTPAKE